MDDSMNIGEELTCSICLELYVDPLQLNCMHSYCKKCTEDIIKVKVKDGGTSSETRVFYVKCPECRMVTSVKRGISDLPKNFVLANIVAKYLDASEGLSKRMFCSLCEETPRLAVKTCLSCSNTSYCRECLAQCHPERGVFKRHTLVDPTIDFMPPASLGQPTLQTPAIISVTALRSISDVARCEVIWDTCIGSKSYKIVCSSRMPDGKTSGLIVAGLDVVNARSFVLDGLRHNHTYNVSIIAVYEAGESTPSDVWKVTTLRKVEAGSFSLHHDVRHNSVVLHTNKLTVTDEVCSEFPLSNVYFRKPALKRVRGIVGSVTFCAYQWYWQTRVYLRVTQKLRDGDLLACVGICRDQEEDKTSPLTESSACLCSAIYKRPGRSEVALFFWDGLHRQRNHPDSEFVLLNLTDADPRTSFTLGFFLDFEEQLLQVVHVQRNVVLFTFRGVDIEAAHPICELHNPKRVSVRLDYQTNVEDIKCLPSCLM